MAYVSFILLTLIVVITAESSWDPCGEPDCVQHVSDFAYCSKMTLPRSNDCRWSANLNRRLDEIILGGKIYAYMIQWHNGSWSGMYVPGYNDIDWKFNLLDDNDCAIPAKANSLRRMWSRFADHTHRYIFCQF